MDIVIKNILIIGIDDIDTSVGVTSPPEQVLSAGANIVPAWRSTRATNYPIHIYISLSKSKQNISFRQDLLTEAIKFGLQK